MQKFLMAWCATWILATSSVMAQQPDVDREKDHDALRGLMKQVTQALNQQDLDALASCFTRDFSLVTIDQSLLTNKASLVAYYDAMFKAPKSFVKSMTANPVADELTRFTGTDTGICHGTSKDTYTMKNGRAVVMESRWTALVVRENGEWKIAAAHAGVNFLDNPLRPRGFWAKFKLLFI